MSKLTKDEVDRQYKEIDEFEKIIPGIRFGSDYPEFALAIIGSSAFRDMVKMATMMGLLNAVLFQNEERKQKIKTGEADKVLDEMIETTQMREQILMAMYLGYRLGKNEKNDDMV